jgi:tRNA modification GTPase
VIEDTIHISGIEFRFIDTAGIRETHDTIETLGVERAYKQIEKARIILLMTDATEPEHQSLQWIEKIESHIREDQHLIILLNKAELVSDTISSQVEYVENSSIVNRKLSIVNQPPIVLPISARSGTGLDILEEALLELVNIKALEDSDVVITNARHYEALVNARTALYRTLNGLHSGTSGDFLAQDIREAMHHLESITGAISSDEILGNIFGHFCIGK